MTGPTGKPPVTVKQGPDWLVDLYFNPPPWVNATIKLLAIVVAAVVVYRLYQRDWRIGLDIQREMQGLAATIVGVQTGVLAVANLTANPYLVDVVAGFATGYGVVLAAQLPAVGSCWSDYVPDERTRRAAVWFVLAVATFGLPPLVAAKGQGLLLTSSRLYLALFEIGLAMYNVMLSEASSPTQTGATGRRH